MAGVKPTFKIEWTKKDNQTESVPGSTYEQMFEFFKKKIAAKKEWAKFHPETPEVSVEPKKGEPITKATLKVGYTITMPSWSKASSVGKKAKAAWDKMMTVLEKHEENHRQILQKQSELFGEKVTSVTDLSLKKLSELFNKFQADLKAAQEKYDSDTSYGQKEGVFLPAPDEVKD